VEVYCLSFGSPEHFYRFDSFVVATAVDFFSTGESDSDWNSEGFKLQ
jgi:hypothetical protein